MKQWEEYERFWRPSIEDPEKFWSEIAEKSMEDIHWFKKWDKVFEWEYPNFRWFVGGLTNAGYNCVDYKLRYSDKTAYIQESPELEVTKSITYKELFDLVERITASLRGIGVEKGDRVLLYLPNSIEAAATVLACARMGAISTCVFSGFSVSALADRIELTKPKAVFTQDFSLRRGKEVCLKETVEDAIKLCGMDINKIVVNRVLDKEVEMKKDRDITFDEFLEIGKDFNGDFIKVEANEPLFIMCTSGTTAKPKPVVHVHGGFQIWSYWTAKWVYGLSKDDVIFNTSDIGWIVGQSYLIFAPLLAGATSIFYDGTPDYPRKDMWWEVMEKHKATLFWTSPTGARLLRKLGEDEAKKHDLSSVQRVVCAGEVLNPEVWKWLYDLFKKPVIDHMWQTEVPGAMFGYPYGLFRNVIVKPGSAGFPMPGVEPEIVSEVDGKVCGRNEKGILLLKKPVPGMTQTLWESHDRYVASYWEATDFSKGRYYTGDSAYIDEEGYIFFCGRADEVIKISGHRIGTIEVENTLVSHPAVAEAGVVGVPDELRGEVLAALVVLKPGYEPSEELKKELIDHVKKTFGPIAVFKGLEFVEMLPKTRSGKIMRRVMRKIILNEPLGDLSTLEAEASVDEVKKAIERFKSQ